MPEPTTPADLFPLIASTAAHKLSELCLTPVKPLFDALTTPDALDVIESLYRRARGDGLTPAEAATVAGTALVGTALAGMGTAH